MNFLKRIFTKKEKNKETVLDFLCCVLSCWLISVGASLIVDAQYSIQIGLKAILWQTLLAIVVSALFTRRWWIPIIYFGVLVPVFFLAIALSGDITTFFQSFAGFVKWWASGMSYASRWYSDQGFYLVHTIINVGIGILFFAVARVFKKAWILVLIAASFVVVNYAYGYTGYDFLAIPFMIAGVFPLIAGEKFQNIKLPDFKNRFGVCGKKWLFVSVATLLAVVISALSFAVANNTKGSVRNRFCSDVVADIQTAANTYTKDQKKVNLTLFDLGLVINSTYVGGNLYNIRPRTIAATNLTEPTLVKMSSFDTFDGMMWTNGPEKSYRINGLWDYEQNAYLAGEAVSNPKFIEELSTVAEKTEITMVLSENSFFLPSVAQVIGFTEKTETINPVLYDKRGRLLSYYGFEKGYSYTIEALLYDTSQKVLNTQFNRLKKTFEFGQDPLYDKQCEFYKSFTQLPSELPLELQTALTKLGLENLTEFEKAFKICEYFNSENGFVYAREQNSFKRGDNIIQKLFQTKKGHCMYYSTAMVIMARAAGIPSRLAAGYKTVDNPNGALQIIDASSPYAWVECYIPNIGWLTFNPSPEETIKPDNSNKNEILSGNQATAPDINVDAETKKKEQNVAGTNLKWKTALNIPLIVLLSLVLIAVMCVILNAVFSQRFYEIEKVRKRFTSTRAQAEFYYRDILRQFYWLGFSFKKGETISELTNRVCQMLPSDCVQVVEMAIKTIEELRYGDITPDDDAVMGIFKARTELEKVLAQRNNKVFYILKRRLLLPSISFAAKKYK